MGKSEKRNDRRRGGQPGNQNALKHGRYTPRAKAERRWMRDLEEQSAAHLRVLTATEAGHGPGLGSGFDALMHSCRARHSSPDLVWHWHRETTTALGLSEHLRVHSARHHWAVLNLHAGVPVRMVECQLGHATPTLTLGPYGAFLPSADDRATWRAQVTSHEAKRRGMRNL